MITDFSENGLKLLIENRVEEGLHLDYKGAGSVSTTDAKKKEIGKDISAFANSDGGMVIYGISEFNDKARRHLPEKIDPINRIAFSKEWLEQVINSNIQPKIIGLKIYPISIDQDNVVYMVEIPKSNSAHQASDKRYYRRYNFESVAMEDYEIKDIFNRNSRPDLHFLVETDQTTYDSNVLRFPILVGNNSIRVAKDLKITVEFIDFLNYNIELSNGFDDQSNINLNRKLYSNKDLQLIIFNGINLHVGQFQLRFVGNIQEVNVKLTMYCDNMSPSIDVFGIKIENGSAVYVLPE